MTILEVIDSVSKALKSGAHPNIVRLALMSDGFSPQKVEVMIAWARQHNKAAS